MRRELVYSKEYNFAYCPIPKAASSFWFFNTLQLDPELGPLFLRHFPQKIRKSRKVAAKKLGISMAEARNISSLLSFVMVRHPFERIASTYFNKIIDFGFKDKVSH